MKSKKRRQLPLARRITLLFLLVSIILSFICVIISVRFVFPRMIESALVKNSYIATAATNQIDDSLKSLINSINTTVNSKPFKDAVHAYAATPDNSESQAAKLNLLMGTYVHNSGFCRRLILDDFDHHTRFSSIGAEKDIDESVFQSEEYQKIIDSKKENWTSPILENPGDNTYSMAYCMKTNIDNKDYIATAFIDVTRFMQYMKDIEGTVFDDYTFYDSYGNLLLSGSGSDRLPEYESNKNIYLYLSELKDSESEHFITSIGNNNLAILIGYVTNATLFKDFQTNFFIIIILFILIILITDLIMLPVIRRKLHPLQDLSQAMQDISSGKVDSRLHLDTGDEITTLCDIYNNMLDTLQENTAELIAREKERNKMKYSLLISQLDPHFLFNTMNIINSLARSSRNDDVILVNSSLMNLLQDRLRISSTEITDSIEHEISIVKEYLNIVQIRWEMEVEIIWNCPENLLTRQIPKNILQPIIENCFKHGLYDLESGTVSGRITISFYEKDNYLYIVIEDNGTGFSEEFLDQFYNRIESVNPRGKHIGLKNISDRLKFLNPDIEMPLKPENITPHGARITLTIV